MANIRNITLTGAETEVSVGGQNADIRNDGTDVVYASCNEGITAGADGVLSIPAGGSAVLLDTHGTVYLKGTGAVTVVGTDYAAQVFKSAAAGGGSSEDTVARTAISTHAENAAIHLTAETVRSMFPSALPANGGNADTVGGKSASDFVQGLYDLGANWYTIFANLTAQGMAIADWYATKNDTHGSYAALGSDENAAGEPGVYLDIRDGRNGEIIRLYMTPYATDGQHIYRISDGAIIEEKWAKAISADKVGKYTEAAIQALENRIAALEGKV